MANEKHKVLPETTKLTDIKLTDERKSVAKSPAKVADIKLTGGGDAPVKPPAKAMSHMTQELGDWSKWIKDNPKKASKIIREWLEHEET
ncbi:MAG: hypothetical protein H7844_04900 [Nitrospirae bacterium YQR-1]